MRLDRSREHRVPPEIEHEIVRHRPDHIRSFPHQCQLGRSPGYIPEHDASYMPMPTVMEFETVHRIHTLLRANYGVP